MVPSSRETNGNEWAGLTSGFNICLPCSASGSGSGSASGLVLAVPAAGTHPVAFGCGRSCGGNAPAARRNAAEA